MLTLQDVEQMSPAYMKVLDSVPKGNSEFQTAMLGTKHVQDQRTRRSVILEINGLEASLHDNTEKFTALQADIRIAERKIARLRREIENCSIEQDDVADKKDEIIKLQATIDRDRFTLRRTEALAKDAVIKLKELIKLLNELPEWSREEFEKREPGYYLQRILQEAVQQFAFEGRINSGTIDTLMRIPVKLDGSDEVRSLKIGEILSMVMDGLKEHAVDARLPHHVEKLIPAPQP